jgi:hypothetical protein
MRKSFFFILLFFLGQLKAQNQAESLSKDLTLLVELGKTIREHPEYQIRKQANDDFLSGLQAFLENEENYELPLNAIKNISVLTANKNKFKLCTWLMRDSLYRYKSFGLVAAKTRKRIVVTRLEDKGKAMSQPEFKILKPNKWMGAVYYKMIPVKKKRKTIYTLLGYAPDEPIQRKIIDVITVDRRGRPKFGGKIFYIEDFQDKKFRKPPMRLILAYSSDYSASVKWNEEEEIIVMDHLSPPDAKLKGVYRTYGPDMSYDSLEWDDGWWHLKVGPKFNSGQNVEIRPPDKPVGPPPGNR